MDVIRSIWDFKLNQYPDGIIRSFKSIFCARGNMQIEGIYFFETYAPVVQWTTIHLMIFLEILLQFKSKQGDITAAFLHTKLEEKDKVFVNISKGFEQYDKRGN